MMLRQFLVTSVFLASGAFGVAPYAKADTATVSVPFSTTVTTQCAFGTPAPGLLGATGTSLSTGNSGGASGAVTLNCNSSATLTATPPQPTTAAATAYMSQEPSCFSSVNFIGGNFDCSTPISTTFNGSALLSVDMGVSGPAVTAGDYGFEIILSATPL